MRPGPIITIIVVIAVLIGGIIWYNNTQDENARVEQQDREQAEPVAPELDNVANENAAISQDEAANVDERPIVVGDEITDDTIVVESTTDTPTILDADEVETSSEIITDGEPEAPLNGETALETDADTQMATLSDPEQLLTPENFQRDEILALINEAEQLSADQRSTLRAMVEGANENPDMIGGTVMSIRAALGLPPLN